MYVIYLISSFTTSFNTCTLLSNGHSVEYHMHDVCHSDTYTYINISIIYSNKLETACLIFSSETRLNSIICNIYFVNESYSVLLTSNILTLTVPVNRGDNSWLTSSAIIGMSSVAVAVLLVISVAPATMMHRIKFITHGSRSLNTRNWHPTQRDSPEVWG